MPFDGTKQDDDAVVQLLLDARAKIDTPDKWVKHFEHVGHRHCLVGAINSVASNAGKQWGSVYRIAATHIQRCLPVTHNNIASYNDAISTTHADILALVDRAIENRRALVVMGG